jgi:hypothetical protein
MKLRARLVLMITIVVAVADLVEYFHLKQHPDPSEKHPHQTGQNHRMDYVDVREGLD